MESSGVSFIVSNQEQYELIFSFSFSSFFCLFIFKPVFHTCSLLAHHGNDMSG